MLAPWTGLQALVWAPPAAEPAPGNLELTGGSPWAHQPRPTLPQGRSPPA